MYTLRDYQKESINETLKFLMNNKENPCIVLPTGSGKSVVIAFLIKELLLFKPKAKIAVVTHVKELVTQNHEKFRSIMPDINTGIYSAGIGRKELKTVTFGSIQSIFKVKGFAFDYLIVDEAHRIPSKGDGLYLRFIERLKNLNGDLRVIGFTATPYRMASGMIVGKDRIFSKIIYEVSVKSLIAKGYLCKVVATKSNKKLDFSSIAIKQGEFDKSALEKLMIAKDNVEVSIRELLKHASNRKRWLIFCSGKEHAFKVCDELKKNRISSEVLTSDNDKSDRDLIIKKFKSGELRCLVNVNVLTEGFDSPEIDLIVLLRATLSPGLFYQMVGRGLRTSLNKPECLVLDFGGNVSRHGAIDAIKPVVIGSDERKKVKFCPECGFESVPIADKVCPECGYKYEKKVERTNKIYDKPADEHIISEVQTMGFIGVRVFLYNSKKNGKDYVVLRYFLKNVTTIDEYFFLDHEGYARTQSMVQVDRILGMGHRVESSKALYDKFSKIFNTKVSGELTFIKQAKFDKVLGMTLNR